MLFTTVDNQTVDPESLETESLEKGDAGYYAGGKLYSEKQQDTNENKSMAPAGQEPEGESLCKTCGSKLHKGACSSCAAKSLTPEGLEGLGEHLEKAKYLHRRRGPKGEWIYEYPQQRKDRRGLKAAGQPMAPKPKSEDFGSVAGYLEARDSWKAQGEWVPASGGTEKPFVSRSGKRLHYVYQPRSGKHAYYDVDNDIVLTDEEAAMHLPGGALARSLTEGLDALEDLLKATPVNGLTPGGYRVKMVGGKRQYVKEGSKPKEKAAEPHEVAGKKFLDEHIKLLPRALHDLEVKALRANDPNLAEAFQHLSNYRSTQKTMSEGGPGNQIGRAHV